MSNTTKIISPTHDSYIDYNILHHPEESRLTGRTITEYDDMGNEQRSYLETYIHHKYDTHLFTLVFNNGDKSWCSVRRYPHYSQNGQNLRIGRMFRYYNSLRNQNGFCIDAFERIWINLGLFSSTQKNNSSM